MRSKYLQSVITLHICEYVKEINKCALEYNKFTYTFKYTVATKCTQEKNKLL